MNKKLLAAAVAAAMAAPAAFADSAVIYGKIHPQVVYSDASVPGPDQDNWQLGDAGNTRLGFKGSEDLGNGLKAIWKYEMAYDLDEGGGIGAARNSYLGLSGDWGTVLFGRHDTPFKSAWYASGVDQLDGSIVDFNLAGGQGLTTPTTTAGTGNVGRMFQEVRSDDVIAYVSPNMSGFQVSGAIIPGESTSVGTGGTGNDGLADTYSLGLTYKGHGVKFGAGYESLAHDQSVATADDQDQWHVSATYSISGFTVGGSYMDVDNLGTVRNREQTTWGLIASYDFGNNRIGVNYADSEIEFPGVADTELTSWGIFAQHKMSKRTSAYVAYNQAENEAPGVDNELDQFAVGMIHVF